MKIGSIWFAICCGSVITSMWTVVKAYNETDIYTNVAYENVTNLYKDLLPSYDKRVRPVRNQSHAVTVTFAFSLSNIIYFDTAYQRLSVMGTFFFFWNDEYLRWNYSSYGGLKVAKLPLSQVCTEFRLPRNLIKKNGTTSLKTVTVLKWNRTIFILQCI